MPTTTRHVRKNLDRGNVPEKMEGAIVILILKPGKNLAIAENSRPISLTSSLCKVLEWILNKRLVHVHIVEERANSAGSEKTALP
jgi:hypothetical protein